MLTEHFTSILRDFSSQDMFENNNNRSIYDQLKECINNIQLSFEDACEAEFVLRIFFFLDDRQFKNLMLSIERVNEPQNEPAMLVSSLTFKYLDISVEEQEKCKLRKSKYEKASYVVPVYNNSTGFPLSLLKEWFAVIDERLEECWVLWLLVSIKIVKRYMEQFYFCIQQMEIWQCWRRKKVLLIKQWLNYKRNFLIEHAERSTANVALQESLLIQRQQQRQQEEQQQEEVEQEYNLNCESEYSKKYSDIYALIRSKVIRQAVKDEHKFLESLKENMKTLFCDETYTEILSPLETDMQSVNNREEVNNIGNMNGKEKTFDDDGHSGGGSQENEESNSIFNSIAVDSFNNNSNSYNKPPTLHVVSESNDEYEYEEDESSCNELCTSDLAYNKSSHQSSETEYKESQNEREWEYYLEEMLLQSKVSKKTFHELLQNAIINIHEISDNDNNISNEARIKENITQRELKTDNMIFIILTQYFFALMRYKELNDTSLRYTIEFVNLCKQILNCDPLPVEFAKEYQNSQVKQLRCFVENWKKSSLYHYLQRRDAQAKEQSRNAIYISSHEESELNERLHQLLSFADSNTTHEHQDDIVTNSNAESAEEEISRRSIDFANYSHDHIDEINEDSNDTTNDNNIHNAISNNNSSNYIWEEEIAHNDADDVINVDVIDVRNSSVFDRDELEQFEAEFGKAQIDEWRQIVSDAFAIPLHFRLRNLINQTEVAKINSSNYNFIHALALACEFMWTSSSGMTKLNALLRELHPTMTMSSILPCDWPSDRKEFLQGEIHLTPHLINEEKELIYECLEIEFTEFDCSLYEECQSWLCRPNLTSNEAKDIYLRKMQKWCELIEQNSVYNSDYLDEQGAIITIPSLYGGILTLELVNPSQTISYPTSEIQCDTCCIGKVRASFQAVLENGVRNEITIMPEFIGFDMCMACACYYYKSSCVRLLRALHPSSIERCPFVHGLNCEMVVWHMSVEIPTERELYEFHRNKFREYNKNKGIYSNDIAINDEIVNKDIIRNTEHLSMLKVKMCIGVSPINARPVAWHIPWYKLQKLKKVMLYSSENAYYNSDSILTTNRSTSKTLAVAVAVAAPPPPLAENKDLFNVERISNSNEQQILSNVVEKETQLANSNADNTTKIETINKELLASLPVPPVNWAAYCNVTRSMLFDNNTNEYKLYSVEETEERSINSYYNTTTSTTTTSTTNENVVDSCNSLVTHNNIIHVQQTESDLVNAVSKTENNITEPVSLLNTNTSKNNNEREKEETSENMSNICETRKILVFNDEDICSICLLPLAGATPTLQTRCKHWFHAKCIIEVYNHRRNRHREVDDVNVNTSISASSTTEQENYNNRNVNDEANTDDSERTSRRLSNQEFTTSAVSGEGCPVCRCDDYMPHDINEIDVLIRKNVYDVTLFIPTLADNTELNLDLTNGTDKRSEMYSSYAVGIGTILTEDALFHNPTNMSSCELRVVSLGYMAASEIKSPHKINYNELEEYVKLK